MTHTITLDGALFQCPSCAWRAILTTDARIIQTEPGEPAHDHIGQAQALRDARRAHIEQTMTRLRKQYAERAEFAGCTLSLHQLQRLYRCVMTEHGYGRAR
jgi:hypothetical protein